jgi:hypothetical protein
MKGLLKGESGIATVLLVVLIVVTVVVAGTVITAVVILGDNVTVTVHNQSCGTLDLEKASTARSLNFLPGVNVPKEIAQGDTAKVQVPKRFLDSVTVQAGSVEMKALGFTFSTGSLDMQLSTWDGTPLAEMVGQEVEISKSHTLVLECN